MQQPDYSISTPENVDLHLELAGVGNRVLACLIDSLISYALMAVLGLILWGLVVLSGAVSAIANFENSRSLIVGIAGMVGIFLLFCIVFGYYIFFEGTWQGQTPGKRIVHIRVIEMNGQPVGWSGVILRNLIRTLDTGLAFVGLLPMIIDKKERRFGDYAAGTIVIRERTPDLLDDSKLLEATPSTEIIDVGRITPQEYDLLVNFLKRRNALAKTQQPIVAKQLCDHFRQKLDWTADDSDERLLEKIYASYKARAIN